ncbi:MAG: sigma-E factor negative regulatory protein RseA [Cellvibrionaceae bacterium]|jgi:sigma-E factor negative regulatory protein RseA
MHFAILVTFMSKQVISKLEPSSNLQLDESLSALMDGEATEIEIRRILKSNGEVKQSIDERWMRYHITSDVLKGEFKLGKSIIDVSASISAAIDAEPTYSGVSDSDLSKKAKKEKVSFWSNLGKFAIAASVAGAVVVGVQFSPSNTGSTIANTPVTLNTPANIASQPNFGGDTSVRVVGNQAPLVQQQKPIVINEATQEQLQKMEGEINRLMLEHAQDGSQNTQQGVLPYVRVPGTDQ